MDSIRVKENSVHSKNVHFVHRNSINLFLYKTNEINYILHLLLSVY